MKYILINGINYLIMKDEHDAIDEEEIEKRFTEYFADFDYVVGDWSYGKLRLKGFNSKTNPKFKEINDIDKVDDYLKNYCAFQCRYFILSKETNKDNDKNVIA